MPASSLDVRTPAQNNRLWATLSQLSKKSGQSRDDLRPLLDALCMKASGQASTARLSPGQADVVIQGLEREAAKYRVAPAPNPKPTPAEHKPWGDRGPGTRAEQKITRFQQLVITSLFELLGMDADSRRKFTEKQCKVPWAQTHAQADALIEPLSQMAMRRQTVAGLRARVAALQKIGGLDAWKTGFVADVARQLAEAGDGSTPRQAGISTHKLCKLLECESAAGLVSQRAAS